MKLFYYNDPASNFGDDLNPWLWPRLIPGALDQDGSVLFIGIGSILDERIPAGPLKMVFGTGIGYGRLPATDERWKICCVRGPITARALGLPPDVAVTDPAALVRTLLPASVSKLYPLSFMPHFRTGARAAAQGVDLRVVCGDAGINYIDPSGDVAATLRSLHGSEMVIAEAMHGAIVADALRIPWIPVQLYDHIRDLKWWDWCKSLDLQYEATIFTSSRGEPATETTSFLQRVKANGRPTLSSQAILDNAIERLQERLECARMEWSAAPCFTGNSALEHDPEALKSVPWLYDIERALKEVASVVPVGESFILVDDTLWGDGQMLAGRLSIPFLERDGQYWGQPSTGAEAIVELERLRQAGTGYIVFAWQTFWWLDHYTELNQYLRATYNPVLSTDKVLVFRL